jgi:hypothetical protein
MTTTLPNIYELGVPWFDAVTKRVRITLDGLDDASRSSMLTVSLEQILGSRKMYDEHLEKGLVLTTTLAGGIVALVGYDLTRGATPHTQCFFMFLAGLGCAWATLLASRYRSVLSASYNLYFASVVHAAHVYFAFGFPPAHPWMAVVAFYAEGTESGEANGTSNRQLMDHHRTVRSKWLAGHPKEFEPLLSVGHSHMTVVATAFFLGILLCWGYAIKLLISG